mmetsp:Transcript_56009/g.90714  ORF Transcript_56009/g.90714 Transcript_56009/m.90714 type:complete len:219 (-) Transcript_56009:646-1302(-)
MMLAHYTTRPRTRAHGGVTMMRGMMAGNSTALIYGHPTSLGTQMNQQMVRCSMEAVGRLWPTISTVVAMIIPSTSARAWHPSSGRGRAMSTISTTLARCRGLMQDFTVKTSWMLEKAARLLEARPLQTTGKKRGPLTSSRPGAIEFLGVHRLIMILGSKIWAAVRMARQLGRGRTMKTARRFNLAATVELSSKRVARYMSRTRVTGIGLPRNRKCKLR